MLIGYARVSTVDQNLDLQIDALQKAGCERIFQEKISGTKKNRPELDRMVDALRPGDTVVVYKLDRLGRSTVDLINIVTKWREKEIGFQSLTDGIKMDDSAMGKLMFSIFAILAQYERDTTSERTKAGLAARRKLGRVGGRPKGLSQAARMKAAAAKTLYMENKLSARQIAEQLHISTNTLYKYLRYMKVEINSEKNSQTGRKMKNNFAQQ